MSSRRDAVLAALTAAGPGILDRVGGGREELDQVLAGLQGDRSIKRLGTYYSLRTAAEREALPPATAAPVSKDQLVPASAAPTESSEEPEPKKRVCKRCEIPKIVGTDFYGDDKTCKACRIDIGKVNRLARQKNFVVDPTPGPAPQPHPNALYALHLPALEQIDAELLEDGTAKLGVGETALVIPAERMDAICAWWQERRKAAA